VEKHCTPSAEKIIQFNESAIQGHLYEMVRQSVETTLNQMLEAEADRSCHAEKYQRGEARKDTRAGFYQRKLHTKAGEVTLNMPKLRRQTFETAIIERYRRREASVEEALIEMYPAGVSVRRVEEITEALWGARVSPGTISKLNQKVYKSIEAWRSQPIIEPFAYVYLDGVVLKRSWAGEVSNVSVLVAIGVNDNGYRKIQGVAEGAEEDKAGWSSFLRHLKERGLTGVRLLTTDACLGLVESLGEFFPEARWQRCTVHFYRNVLSHVQRSRMPVIADMLEAIHAAEDLQAAMAKAQEVVEKLKAMRLVTGAKTLQDGVDQTLTYYHFPREHRRRIRTNNALERIIR
jgi:putative transposase